MPAKTFEDYISLAKSHETEAELEETPVEEEEELYRQAAQAYARACSLNPNSSDALYDWGRVSFILAGYSDEDEYDERLTRLETAIDKFRASLKLDPEFGPCLFNLAQAIVAEADLKLDMEDDYEEHEELTTEFRTKYQEALDLFSKVLEIQKKEMENGLPPEKPVTADDLVETLLAHAETLTSLAGIETSEETLESLYAQAIAKLQQAMEIDPGQKSRMLLEWAGVMEARIEKYAEIHNEMKPDYSPMLEKVEEAIAADPNNDQAYCEKAEVLLQQANGLMLDEAMYKGQNDEQFAPGSEAAKKVWELHNQAAQCLEKAIEINADEPAFHSRYGEIAFNQSRLPLDVSQEEREELSNKAEKAFRKGIELDEDDEQLLIRLAQVLFFRPGNTEEAVNELLVKYKEMGGMLDDVLEEPELFEEEFLNAVADHFPDNAWEDDDEDDEEEDEDDE